MGRKFLIVIWLLAVYAIASAQNPIFTNLGGVVFVNVDARVKVNGAMHNTLINADTGKLLNRGNVYIEGYFKNDAHTEGNGYFEVAGSWINNSVFLHKQGMVKLDGQGVQYITGDSITRFYDLDLAGTGNIKKQTIDAYTEHFLFLNDKELATDHNTMYVTNPDFNAIHRTTGFVSSLENGWLARNVTLPVNYIFPVGSSIGLKRYRPVGISPRVSDPSQNEFKVRMVNNSATTNGFPLNHHDSTICYVNPFYYHWISHSQGSDSASVRLYYYPVDGEYDINAQWDTKSGETMWYNTNRNWLYDGASPYYVLTDGWRNFNPHQFILGRKAPTIYDLVCVPELCAGALGYYYVNDWLPGASYVWSTDGGVFAWPTSTNEAQIVWPFDGTGTVSVYMELENGACKSNELTCTTNVLPQPDANFTPQPEEAKAYDVITFVNHTTPESTYQWSFGDENTSNATNPIHIYENTGIYWVQLIAISPEGCTDTVYKPVVILEGVDIPNVFTPDGDGINDVFRILSSGLDNYSLKIYNRWGNLIFETSTPRAGWDGRTNAGENVPAGTYYYILTAQGTKEPYERTGHVTLMR